MKHLFPSHTTGLALLASITCSFSAAAATYQLTSSLDNTFSNGTPPPMGTPPPPSFFSQTVEAPFVGNMTLSYEAESPLSDGVYAWDSLTSLTLNVAFPAESQTFTQTDLDNPTSEIKLRVIGGNFFFTSTALDGNSTSFTGLFYGGSANFLNDANWLFTTQPLNSETRMGFGGYVVDYNALYQLVDFNQVNMVDGKNAGTRIYGGNYGNPTANVTSEVSAVPEPAAAFGTLGLLASGLLLRRRTSRPN